MYLHVVKIIELATQNCEYMFMVCFFSTVNHPSELFSTHFQLGKAMTLLLHMLTQTGRNIPL